MSNETRTAGKTAAAGETARNTNEDTRDLITSARAIAAKSKLIRSAETLETGATRYLESAEARAIIQKADGKKITSRLFDKLAEAWKHERIDYTRGGGHYYEGLEWKIDKSSWECAAEVTIKADAGYWMRVQIKGKGGSCDAVATLKQWDDDAEKWRKYAAGDRSAAECIDFAAAEYNEIAKRARGLMAELERRIGDKVISPEIRVLCSFSGDIYDRINPFRWHEHKSIDLPINEGRAE